MENHPARGDSISPTVHPQPSDEKSSNPPGKIDGEEEDAANDVNIHPERITNFKDYLRVFTYATKFDYALMIPAAFASIGAGVTLPLMNVVFGLLIGDFNDYFVPNSTATESKFVKSLDRMALYLFILFLARFFLNYVNKFAFRTIGIRMSAAIRAHYLQCLFKQTIHVLDSMPPGSAAGTITAAANTLQLGISEKLGVLIEFTASMIAAIAVAFTYSWSLTLVTTSSIVFISLVLSVLVPVILKQQANQDKAETKANAVASEAFGSIRMIAACGAEGRVAQRFKEWVNEAKRCGLITSPLYALQYGLIFFSLYSTYALAFWYGTKSYYEGRVSGVSTIIVVLMSVMILVVSMERISSPLIAIGKAQIAATMFFTVIDAPRPETGSLRAPDVTATENIIFRDCTFAYPGRPSKKVLDKLNLTIEAGKTTAIIGPSGSGKSTIVGLLERWYSLHDQVGIAKVKETEKGKNTKEVDKEETDKNDGPAGLAVDDTGPPVQLSGSISTCGHELDEIDLKWWRSQIGLVQQDPFLFNDTIFNNVACGLVGTEFENESEEKKRELVVEACKEAFADEFIDHLPDRYDTAVGDSGAKLSGGQRQRVAIARSIISRPKILILDEATSAIDVRGERIVQHALERASRGRTTIMIAHRLSTIKKADHIVVIQSGRIVEQGTHRSLLSNEASVYSSLVHAQQLALGDHGEDYQLEGEDVAAILQREKSAAEPKADNVAQEGSKVKTFGLASGVGRLLYEQRAKWPVYIIVFTAAVAIAAVMPIQAYIFARVIIVFQETGALFVDHSRFWSLMWFILGISVGVGYFTLQFSATQVEHRVGAIYRQEYFESILGQRIAYFDEEDHATGTLTSQALGDPKKFQEILGVQGVQAYIGVFNLLGGVIISFIFSWKLSLLSFFVVMPIGLFCGYYRFKYEVEFNKLYEAVFAESSKWASESIGAIRTVSSLTIEDVICQRYQDLLDGHVSGAIKKARYSSVVFALSDSLSMGCQALIFWVGGRWLVSGEVSAMGFFIVFMAIMSGAEGTGQLLSLAPNASQATAASNRILSARETKLQNTIAPDEGVEDVDGGIKIELRNVNFEYPTRKVLVLKGINITVEKGQFAALVGASGSGKTSIVSLIERFYDVSEGQILFNSKDIYSVNVGEYRKLISLVAQEHSLLQGTIRENILLGVDPSTVTDEQLHQACCDASIHDFIVSLPEGYDSNVGSRGVTLSGGQKQRVAIARALIRDPRVLLLDEATSSLDSESEKLVQAALERAARGRTTIAVAHRLATIQHAQVIFVLGEGRVLEVGSHAELLRKKGVYWHMCQSQALDK